MRIETIQQWLERRRRIDLGISALSTALASVAGAGLVGTVLSVLWMTFMFVIAPIFKGDKIEMILSLIAAAGCVVLLSYDSLVAGRDDMSNPFLWLFRECCSFGPRLLLDARDHARRFMDLKRMNVAGCSSLLSRLASHRRSFSIAELAAASPEMTAAQIRRQLGLIEGILFLRQQNTRVLLTEPLRVLLSPFVRASSRTARDSDPQPEPAPVSEPEKLASHELLGVASNATAAQIKAAYRVRIKECHPDRFAHLGEAARTQAEEWSKALNSAYAEMLAGVKQRP